MLDGRRWPVAGLLAGVVALGLTVVAPGAQAAPAPVASDSSAITTVAATSKAQLASASGYWTPQRLANAGSADRAPAQSATATQPSHQSGPPGSIAPAAATKPVPQDGRADQPRRGDVTPLAVSTSATVGKVFFHDPSNGKDWVCSASTLNSGSKQLVLTAGHCVHGGAGKQYMTNWVFIPRYSYGSQPFGQWQAKYFTTFSSWVSSTDFNRDVAMVTMWPNSSGAVVNVVGGNGLTWNQSYNLAITVMGYPAAAPYDGESQWACQGNTTRFGSEFKIALQCGFTGGSSGGPWFYQYDNNTGLGLSNGATSTLDTASWNRASYFDTAVYNMYTSVANRT